MHNHSTVCMINDQLSLLASGGGLCLMRPAVNNSPQGPHFMARGVLFWQQGSRLTALAVGCTDNIWLA